MVFGVKDIKVFNSVADEADTRSLSFSFGELLTVIKNGLKDSTEVTSYRPIAVFCSSSKIKKVSSL